MLTAGSAEAERLAGAGLFDEGRIDALLAPLDGHGPVLIAVSGGPDSTALLVMAGGWAKRRGVSFSAATVDHRLRPESAAEAASVATLCGRLGVAHATLVWDGEKPVTRLQERAREARYRLLAAHADALNAGVIATAHHADDQAETILFRLLRGSGLAGLSGMEAMSRRDGILLARPLLTVAKAELIAYLRARGASWIRDPSNDDPRYARTRLRALLRRLAEEGLDADGLARFARRAAEADEALDWATDALEARLGPGGRIDAAALLAAPAALVGRAVARRIPGAGLAQIEALAAQLAAAHAEGRAFAANVGGRLVRLSANGGLTFSPEPPRRRRGS